MKLYNGLPQAIRFGLMLIRGTIDTPAWFSFDE